ncbi:MAG TPA: NAD(P)-dependent alcohol dehydrogenase [Anaerolineae bacterium]|nr:NAD(P)-dependent alcohol dehydrogenase [Anaerolineae bacterium]HRJ58240.1 NAD(P)-dependent alcohol dehydrogenase [Anaerolineales bacterium]
MKASVYTRYGPPEVLQLVDIPMPTPRDHEVLVKVRATTVTIGDTIMRSFKLPNITGWQKFMARLILGWNKPKRHILGMELAGEIESIGRKVTRFKPGDAVFASTYDVNFGGHAEYKCLPEKGVIALKPGNLTFEEAAAIPGGGQTAWHCLQKGRLQPGQKVLIYGASGAVGTFAVQLASRHFGADVTGVCSAANADLVKSFGASRVIDYTRQDFTQSGETYDVIFDAVGKLSPAQWKKALKPGGVHINVHADSNGGEKVEYMLILKEMIEEGVIKPVIDRVYPFDHIVEAHRYVEQGHKKGNVAITMGISHQK